MGDDREFLYERISSHLTRGIGDGSLPPGSRLPSLRSMGARWECSLSTVMQAYGDLESKGLIRGVEKSGYFVLPPLRSPLEEDRSSYSLRGEESRPLSVIGRVVEAGNDRSIVPLGAGVPHVSLLPVAGLRQALARVMKEKDELLQEYSDESGYYPLRRAMGKLLYARGISASPEEILITNGCTEALSLAIQTATTPGETVAIESPLFLGLVQILGELKRQVLPIPTSPRSGMDLDILESAMKRGLARTVIMTAAHQNPLGFIMPAGNRERAVRLAETYDGHIIEDDIYGDCSHDHHIRRPLKSWDREGRVLYCSSFSKTAGPGFRIGWLVGGRFHRRCAHLKLTQTLGGSPLLQAAMGEFLSRGHYEKHLLALQKAIFHQSCRLKGLILEHFPRGTTISEPRGGYYFWVRLPGNVNTLDLFHRALEERISTVPGQAFSPGGRYSDCLRLSFGSPVTEETERALALLGSLAGG